MSFNCLVWKEEHSGSSDQVDVIPRAISSSLACWLRDFPTRLGMEKDRREDQRTRIMNRNM